MTTETFPYHRSAYPQNAHGIDPLTEFWLKLAAGAQELRDRSLGNIARMQERQTTATRLGRGISKVLSWFRGSGPNAPMQTNGTENLTVTVGPATDEGTMAEVLAPVTSLRTATARDTEPAYLASRAA